MAAADTDRLFVAIWPPQMVVEQVAAAIPSDLTELRWQPAHRWHVTLGFLGDRSPRKELGRFEALPMPAAKPLRLDGAGTFGPVLWLGVEGEWLTGLARTVVAAFDLPQRRFRGHLTLARARTAAARREQSEAVNRLSGFASSPWTPDSLTLVRSTLGPSPAYEVIGRRRFLSP